MKSAVNTGRNQTAADRQPLLLLLAANHLELSGEWLQTLARLQPEKVFVAAAGEIETAESTLVIEPTGEAEHDLFSLCRWMHSRHPGRACALLAAGVHLPPQWLSRLQPPVAEYTVTGGLSNLSDEHNPFAYLDDSGVDADPQMADLQQADSLIAMAGQAHWIEDQAWPQGAVLIQPAAIEVLAGADSKNLKPQLLLQAAGQTVAVRGDVFFYHPQQPLPGAGRGQPLPALAETGLRLQPWLQRGLPQRLPHPLERPRVILHIVHSWGGGIARWVDDFCRNESDAFHLILESANPQLQEHCGLRLKAHELGYPELDSWILQPPIAVTDSDHPEYREILQRIIQRFGVGQVLVSSLVGHSLEVYRTGLPTIHVTHDYFPTWPLLHHDPNDFISKQGKVDWDRALNSPQHRIFQNQPVSFWHKLRRGWRQQIKQHNIAVTAPSQSAADTLSALLPVNWEQPVSVQPHGLPSPKGEAKTITPKSRQDGKLRLVVLGRIHQGKGKSLLLAALEQLAPLAQIYLLGSGKNGEAFFGRSGVNVIYQYQAEELPNLLAAIGPHAGLLLSTVPETFSYTLSELQAAGIPPLATRMGSFSERIQHQQNGLLIEPNPNALVAAVKSLRQHPDMLDSIRANLRKQRPTSMETMISAYRALFARQTAIADTAATPLAEAGTQIRTTLPLTTLDLTAKASRLQQQMADASQKLERRTQWAESLQHELRNTGRELQELQSELKQSNAWARKVQQQLDRSGDTIEGLQQELKQSNTWAEGLELQLDRNNHRVQELQSELEQSNAWAEGMQEELEQNRSRVQGLQQELEQSNTWAKGLQQALDESNAWAKGLQQELDESNAWAQVLNEKTAELNALIQSMQQKTRMLTTTVDDLREQNNQRREQIQQLTEAYDHSAGQLELVLNSRSWKLTKPLRAANRVLHNAREARVLNPTRWPYLLNRFRHSLAARGWTGTLNRMHYRRSIEAPSEQAIEAPAISVDIEAFSVPGSDAPRVSIIIPVFNQYAHTQTCLKSLGDTICATPFEVIVVDDESSDATQELLAGVAGVRTVRNPENLGFIGSCNRGAEQARGDYLLFLNNDTAVTDHWLDTLMNTFRDFPRAGIVGPRLLFPDGSLQESGGIIFSDGSGWNYGRGQDPNHPRYLFAREADYVSGACLAISKQLFESFGGFDSYYAPAYYEDTDICFKCRDAGHQVIVQPRSTVIHYEGATSGTDITQGAKRHQQINHGKFLQRWNQALQTQPARIDDPQDLAAGAAAATHRRSARILVIDAYTPQPDHDSGSMRMVNLMLCLRDLGYQVTFFAENKARVKRYTGDLQAAGIEVLYNPWIEDTLDFFEQQGPRFEAVIVSRHYVASHYVKFIEHFCPDARFIFDTVDLHYLREQRLAELEGKDSLMRAALHTKRAELDLIQRAHATLVVSPYEKEVLEQAAPGTNVQVVSNIHPVHGSQNSYRNRKDIFFVGGYQHPPNVDAAVWFVESVFPLVRERLPDLKLYLIGSKATSAVEALDGNGVVFKGYVEDLTPYLNGCRLAIAPLRYGAGVKGKVNMSMSYGQPVVATAIAVEGMHAENERHVLVADEAEDFAAAVVRLYQDEDLWNRLSGEGLDNVRQHFSFEAAQQAIAGMLESVGMPRQD